MAPSQGHRVAITGLGAVTPLGPDAQHSWEAVVAGKCGVDTEALLVDGELPVTIAAAVRSELEIRELDPKERRRLDRAVLLALAAADEAIAAAGLADVDGDRVGVSIGSGIGGISTILRNHQQFLERGARRVSPFMIPMSLANLPAGYVAIRHGFTGSNRCPVAACATGAQAIGEAARAIAWGEVDVIVSGGTEAALTPLVVAGFASMQALSTRNDEPARASRPFDAERDGFVLGEGAGMLVLENLEHARSRGATIHAEVLGYGLTSDASHIAAPDPDGRGAERCMRAALSDAGLDAESVGYVNAHATSTPLGDRIEAQTIRRVLGGDVRVSSTKGATGHLLGAAGAVETLFCVRALETGVLPPTINLERPDAECDLHHVAQNPSSHPLEVAMTNAFGFGGTNTCLVLGRWEG